MNGYLSVGSSSHALKMKDPLMIATKPSEALKGMTFGKESSFAVRTGVRNESGQARPKATPEDSVIPHARR